MEDMGFIIVLEEKFTNSKKNIEESCQIWWDDKRGILAFGESYTWEDGTKNLNSCKFYGNFQCFEGWGNCVSSGHTFLTDDIKKRRDLAWGVRHARNTLSDYDSSKHISDQQIAEHLGITVEEVNNRLQNDLTTEELIWIGDWSHEAIRHKLKPITTWKRQWIERPWLWLITYDECDKIQEEGLLIDPKLKRYDEINEGRIKKLPQYIQDCITPK
jgi:hypothetical protein